MSGPWTSPLLDAALASRSTWRADDLLEFKHVYEDGTSQGSSLGRVRAERPGIGFDVNLFWVEQGDLKNWLESDTGHGNPGWYSPARSTATDLTRTVGDPPIQPIGTWRLIGRWNHFTLQEISADAEVMCMRLRAPQLTPGVPLCPRPKRSRTRSLHRAGPRRIVAQEAGEHPPSPCRRRRERTTSTGSHRATHPRAPRTHHATVLLHSMVNFLLFHLSGCLDWTCVASALRHAVAIPIGRTRHRVSPR